MSDRASSEGFDVLVTDDDPLNRKILTDVLAAAGFQVREAADGHEALEMAAAHRFDAILLDVMMPRMSGYDVCRTLKADPATEAIPILLVTALSDRENRLEGISSGASDFLTKPVDIRDLPLRVRNACRHHRLHREMGENLERLRELERLRDDLNHMIVHDMRSPLLGISGHLELLQLDRDNLDPSHQRSLSSASAEASRLVEMVGSLLDLGRLEEKQMPLNRCPSDLYDCAKAAKQALGSRSTEAVFILAATAAEAVFHSDPGITTRIFLNLMDNAVKAGATRIEIGFERVRDGYLRAHVTDNGPGIPAAYRDRIFDKFYRVEMRDELESRSSGVGLSFCKLAAESHGGRIGAESAPGGGSTIWFELPEHAESLALSS